MICVFHYELDGSEKPTPSRYRWASGSLIISLVDIRRLCYRKPPPDAGSATADLRERAGADALTVSSPATGHPLNNQYLRQARQVLPQV